MIGAAAAYVSGLFFASFFFDAMGVIAAVCIAVLVLLYGKIKSFKVADYIILTVFFCGAVTVNRCYTHFVYDKITAYAETEGSFSGQVIDISEYDGDYASYTLKGSINDKQKVRVNIFTTTLDADFGDIIEIENCFFVLPESDYVFDGITHNKSRHVYLEAEKISGISVIKQQNAPIRRNLKFIRDEMTSRMLINMSGDTGGILSGMVFGGSEYISERSENALYGLGIGHILSVSGLHVSAIGAVIMAFLKRLRVNRFIRFAVLNIVLLLMTGLADYPISAVRAALMLDIFYLAEIFGEQNDSLNSIAIAALLISLTDCYIPYSTGFILSFCGTFGIAVFAPYMAKNIASDKWWSNGMKSALSAVCVTLCVMPASIYFFDEVSLISPLANIILLPVCTGAMICGFVFVITGGIFTFILVPAELLITAVTSISEWISGSDLFTISQLDDRLPLLFMLGAMITAYVYLFGKSRKKVNLTLATVTASVIICSCTAEFIMKRQLHIAVLGDDKSAAVVISQRGEVLVVELCGENEDYVEKYLTQKGMKKNFRLLLTDNINRGEAVYSESSLLEPMEIYTCGEEGVCFSNPYYIADYSKGVLIIKLPEHNIVFTDGKSDEQILADMRILYGNVKNSENTGSNSYIINNSGNNFEIVDIYDGSYRIRSF